MRTVWNLYGKLIESFTRQKSGVSGQTSRPTYPSVVCMLLWIELLFRMERCYRITDRQSVALDGEVTVYISVLMTRTLVSCRRPCEYGHWSSFEDWATMDKYYIRQQRSGTASCHDQVLERRFQDQSVDPLCEVATLVRLNAIH